MIPQPKFIHFHQENAFKKCRVENFGHLSRPQCVDFLSIIETGFLRGIQHVMSSPCSEQPTHYNDVIMVAMVSPITSLTSVYLTVYSAACQRKHQSSASLAFGRGIHRWPVNLRLRLRLWHGVRANETWINKDTCIVQHACSPYDN